MPQGYFLFRLLECIGGINGRRKTKQAIKKTMLPMRVSVSWFLNAAVIKKRAHTMNRIHPTR